MFGELDLDNYSQSLYWDSNPEPNVTHLCSRTAMLQRQQ